MKNHIIGKSYYNVKEHRDLRAMLKNSVSLYGDKILYKYRNNPNGEIITRTYKQFDSDIDALGTALIDMGLKNKRIAIIGANSYYWATAYMSVVNGTGVVVPLDRMLTEQELWSLLERSKVSAVFYQDNLHDFMVKYSQSHDYVEKFIHMSHKKVDLGDDPRFVDHNELISHGQELLNNSNWDFVNAKIDPEAANILLFTSGTTNQSKAVMLCHRNICKDIKGVLGLVDVRPSDTCLSILPLHHTFENTCGFLIPISAGAEIAICDGLRHITKNLKEYKITIMIGVPLLFESIYNKIIEQIKKQKKYQAFKAAVLISRTARKMGIDLRKKLFKDIREPLGGHLRLFVSGAAAMSPSISKGFEDLAITVTQGYGLTETSPVVSGCNDFVLAHGTVGHPVEGVEVKVDSDKPGQPGEILIKGPIVMLGYLDDPKATKEAIVDGWFHTGDLGVINKKGLLKITGRLKTMIVLENGKKIFPEEVESLLNKLPFIKESMVFGHPSPKGETEVVARLVLDKDVIEKEIGNAFNDEVISKIISPEIKTVNKQMPSFKSIKYFFFGYDDLTKTTTKKIKRHIEIENIGKILSETAHSIKEAAGKNFDKIKELYEEKINGKSKK